MKDNVAEAANAMGRSSSEPAIQVICLGSGGGPSEDDVTGLLVRSTASNWSKGSLLAVDAGSHLAAITRILEETYPRNSDDHTRNSENQAPPNGAQRRSTRTEATFRPPLENVSNLPSAVRPTASHPSTTTLPTGPFAGLPLPHKSARANAGVIVREHVATYLITHAHLDHLSGFAINTAAFHNTSRPKRLTALPGTVDAIKQHIFNDVIWPNLTDEDGGVGFVTFQRLAEGGNIALGAGEGRGYIEVCDGLSVRGWKVSHGHCMKPATSHLHHHPHLHGGASSLHRGSFSAPSTIPGTTLPTGSGASGEPAQQLSGQHALAAAAINGVGGTPRRREDGRRSMSIGGASQSGTPAQSSVEECVIDSTAFFIRTTTASCGGAAGAGGGSAALAAEKEILVFGDVEPDSVSLNPRTARVWAEAAPKIAHGVLKAVFIECSYDDTQDDAVLFGHLAPRHLVKELVTLAQMVKTCQAEEVAAATATTTMGTATTPLNPMAQTESDVTRKRKRLSGEHSMASPASTPRVGFETPSAEGGKRSRSRGRGGSGAAASRASSRRKSKDEAGKDQQHDGDYFSSTPQVEPADVGLETTAPPLASLTVVVIHVKDTLRDGPLVGENILRQLKEHEARFAEEGQPLGCEFVISKTGASYSF
ncbi:MAG: hypothetical protein Q9157_003329 [Trypethelium eluteriae]